MSKPVPKSKETPLNSLELSDSDTEDESPVQLKKGDAKDNEIPTEELIKKKKARLSRPLNEEMLMSADGLQRVYDEFTKSCPFHGRGSEARDLRRLTTTYKEWAFQLHPGVAFPDFLIKCEQLGTKASTKGHIQILRDKERDRYVTEVLGISRTLEEEVEVPVVSTTPTLQVHIPSEESPPPVSQIPTPHFSAPEFVNPFPVRSKVIYDEDEEFDENNDVKQSSDHYNNNDFDEAAAQEEEDRRLEEELANMEDI